MGAIGVHHTGTNGGAFDGPAQETNARNGEDRAYYARIYAWEDPAGDPTTKAAYRFVHHFVSAAGEPGDASVRGCRAGIGVLNGARGGTTIPATDRQGTYDHLASHLRDANVEPPPLAQLEDLETAAHVAPGVLLTARSPRFAPIIRALSAFPWAILPAKMDEILAFLELVAAGDHVDPAIVAEYAAAGRPSDRQAGAIAVLPLQGVIAQKMNLMSAMSGGTSTERFAQAFRDALDNPQVSAIVIDVDSPGGNVFGVDELASEIRAARGAKPIVAVANSLMASAAYWIGAQADELVVTPGGQVGSIGVIAVHTDYSGANEQAGIRPTIISAGKYKAEGADAFPLSEEARGHAQGMVDEYYGSFVGAVAAGRGASRSDITNGYGQGRVLGARAAKAAGLVDRIGTLDETLARLSTPQGRTAVLRQRAALEPLEESSEIPTKRAAERALRDVGLSQTEAKAILSRGWDDSARDVPEGPVEGPSIELLRLELELLATSL
jgi:signal peptide peptidase SppA